MKEFDLNDLNYSLFLHEYNFDLLLLSPKCMKFEVLLKDLLVIIILRCCPAFWWFFFMVFMFFPLN
jgi:hypothetical protein